MMDAALEHIARQPSFVLLRAISRIGPYITGRVVRIDHMSQLASIALSGRGHLCLADEPVAPIDADMGFVAKHRGGNLDTRNN